MKQKFVIIAGIAGVGKTTIAEKLMETLRFKNYTYIDKDTIQDCFTDSRENEYFKQIVGISYDILFNLIKLNLKVGNNVIICGPFNKFNNKQPWERIQHLVDEFDIDFKYIWCYANEDEIKQRLVKRGLNRDKTKLGDWNGFLEKEPILPEIPFEHFKFNVGCMDIQCIIDYIIEE